MERSTFKLFQVDKKIGENAGLFSLKTDVV